MAAFFGGLCNICGGDDLHGGEDGFFYCSTCGSQSQRFQEQALDYDNLAAYTRRANRASVPPPPTTGKEAEDNVNELGNGLEGTELGLDDLHPSLSQAFIHSHLGFDDAKPWEVGGVPQNATVPKMRGASRREVETMFDPMETMDEKADVVRKTYIDGVQEIIQMLCEAMVEKFKVSPVICGIVGPIWLRYIVFSRVFDKDWPKEVIQLEEAKTEDRRKKMKKTTVMTLRITKKRKKKMPKMKKEKTQKKKEGIGPKQTKQEEVDGNCETQETNEEDVKTKEEDMETKEEDVKAKDERLRVRMELHFIYLRAIRLRIPLSISLAIVFLGCHIAQESILPTDIIQGAVDGSLPYLSAFRAVEKKAGFSWPIEARFMLKPLDVIGAKRLEFMAALIAKRINLDLPPVNFHAISSRLLTQLNLPVDKLSIYVSRFHDWYAPPGLWLSVEGQAVPSRVYVMAMVIIVLRVLYKLDGRWYWRKSLVDSDSIIDPPIVKKKCNSRLEMKEHMGENEAEKNFLHMESHDILALKKSIENPIGTEAQKEAEDDKWNVMGLLETLENAWQDRGKVCFDLQKDLGPYLKYCQDLVYSGLNLESEEEYICEQLWKLYAQLPKKEMCEELEKVDIPDIHSLSGEDSHFSFKDKKPSPMDMDPEVSTFVMCETSIMDSLDTTIEGNLKVSEDLSVRKEFRSIEQLIHDMNELGFVYLPPREQPLASNQYLRYFKKKSPEKHPPQVLHADYFILLCACAKIISVHPIALYLCVTRLESRICCIEREAKKSHTKK